MSAVTAMEVDQLCAAIRAKKLAIQAVEHHLAELREEQGQLLAKMAAYLENANRKNFQSPSGTAYTHSEIVVTVPKTPEDKAALFAWLKERDIYDQYVTVNHASLKSLINEEFKEAQAEKRELVVPGVGPIKLFTSTRFRENKHVE